MFENGTAYFNYVFEPSPAFFFFCVTLGEISNHNKKLFVKNYLMLFMIMMTTKLMIDGATVSIVRGDI